MGMLRKAVEAYRSHDVVAHTIWASTWTGVLVLLGVVIDGEQLHVWSVLGGVAIVGGYHLLFRFGRWADRRGAANVFTRRATALAWAFPAIFPAAMVWEAVAA